MEISKANCKDKCKVVNLKLIIYNREMANKIEGQMWHSGMWSSGGLTTVVVLG